MGGGMGGGGFGRSLLAMALFGAGVSVAVVAVSSLFGGRGSRTERHAMMAPPPPPPQQSPSTQPRVTASNPALTRPITNCAEEEEVYRQCLKYKGDCAPYLQRMNKCHQLQVEGKI